MVSIEDQEKQAGLENVYEESFQEEKPPQATNIIDKVGLRFNAEIRGVQRVTDEQKNDTNYWNALTMFLSPNLAISAFSSGALGPLAYGLDFWTSVLCIIFLSVIGALPVAFYSVFGQKSGLRQQILSRFFCGNIMGRVFGLFNVISCIGWNAVNIIPAVQLLASLGPLPPWAGCLIFVVITCILALFGYKTIHYYERISWIPNFIIYLIIIARLTKSKNFTFGKMETGTAEAGNVLSYMSLVFGFTSGWAPSAADYFVYMDTRVPSWKIFVCMVIGLSVPCMFAFIIGVASAMGTYNDPTWASAYAAKSIGGLVYQILVPNSLHGFGKFCCVVLSLSAIANNLPGSYSLSLAIQAVWSPLAKFPRLGWCLIGNFVSLGLSIPAYYVFADTMSNFLSIISYNVSIYLGISLAEHFIYRKGFKGYDVSNFNDRKTIPVGFAGVTGFAFGVASTVLSMNQSWYHGVISKKFGATGGDISFELNILFAFIGYNIIRPIELKYFGR
ncbi:hypothetical protein HYPBUDRAFT_152726 [Hyphopichia burtonii NRRL Y-1933]|uniref:Purine-cytosine permease n=1 Tax=Hyphopichia burtonii NRRL Y-1933 TaxID=984485 RepID=A0A1E4RLC7_9ASCO|nr:hypothetical protein HYPBUDRAFT_152726 [Hyphopichia burtonii NRRL Y-1933]ODV68068.1 hypothetical protein HYPBUDRAFT_152726 [Hyphopichia burtonii NRRL Y-1933]